MAASIRNALRRPETALFVLAFVAYAYFYQAGGWNQNVRYDLVRSLVEQRTTVIDDYRRNSGDLSCWGDNGTCKGQAQAELHEHYYCDKAPGNSFLGTIPQLVIHTLSSSQKPSASALNAGAYATTVFSVALPSALGVVALFLILGGLGLGLGWRLLLSVGYALSTLAFPYSTLLYGHQTAAALLLGGCLILFRARQQRQSQALMFAAGLMLGYSVVCEYPAALIVIVLSIYALIFVRPYQALAAFILGGALCAILLGAYHTVAFGGPLTLPYEFSTQHFRGLGYFMGLGAPNWEAFSNTMFTPYRGLFYSAPWLLLAFPGAIVLIIKKRFRAEALVCLFSFLLFMWMTASLIDSWHGGWSLGSRYMIPAIPFLVVLMAGLHSTAMKRWMQNLLVALALSGIGFSGFLMLAGTAVRPEVPQQVKKPFGQYLLPHFYAGKLAINPQGIDMPGSPRNGPPKAWNLGQGMGLTGLMSLLPLLALLGTVLAWLVLVARQPPGQLTARPPKQ